MSLGTVGAVVGTLVGLNGVSVVAQSLGPSVLVDVPGSYRAVGSFVLVLLAGALVLYRSERFVDHSIDASMEKPHISLLYGFIAFGLVVFVGLLALSQLTQLGITVPVVSYVAIGLIGLAMVLLAGLGYAVLGARLTELWGPRQAWNGLVFGAALSAVGWLLLPIIAGTVTWVAGASLGIGGPVREWIHEERTVESETSP